MNEAPRLSKSALTRRTLLKGAAATSLAAGGLARPAIARDMSITALTMGQGIFGQPLVELTPAFTKATGIKVNLITMGYNESIEKQVAAFAAHSSAYDVVQIDSIYLKGYVQAGHLKQLDNLVPQAQLADFFSDIPPALRQMYSADGKTYGMATVANCQRLIANTVHLKAAGLGVPQTWDDLLAASQKTVNPGAKQFGFVAGTERLIKAFSVWLPIFWANGGELFDAKMKPIFGDQTGVDALTFLLELMKTMPTGGAAYTEADETRAMATGLGTLDPVAWIPDAIVTASPDMRPNLVSAVSPKGKVCQAPVMGGMGLTVSNYSRDAQAAAEYLAWFNSRDVQSKDLVPHGGQPCRNSAWAANASAKPWFPAVAASLKVAKIRPQLPEWGQIDSAAGVQLSRAFVGEITPQQAMQNAQKAADGIMRDAGYY
ncbi:ABC transporter substrate-binding protein [Acidisoma silvae]|uniref:Extracellular solute-binding protein n=1 Tax=Acidisoma silvae TaxID=2802396 RepID=A0A963YXD5_9PROT|nr:extracellular solute-binding protein [Acidisoma silvae]MCB8878082.1 extracellular solute-binding protein [Acidisoma silvae]